MNELDDLESTLEVANLLLNDLWESNYETKTKSTKLLNNIIYNIINNPNDEKYLNLNYLKLNDKLSPIAFEILYLGGFTKDDSTNRLVFDVKQLSKLQQIFSLLNEKLKNDEKKNNNNDNGQDNVKSISSSQVSNVEDEEILKKLKSKWSSNKKEKEQLKKQIELDKQDVSKDYKPKISSQANNLKFGRTDVKVEFKSAKGG